MYTFRPAYPTIEHEQAAQRLVEFFSQQPDVAAVILKCSCARGKATRDSCLDICILLPSEISIDRRFDLEQAWDEFHLTETIFKQLRQVGKYSHLDLDFHDSWFTPTDHEHHWTSGADSFELDIGNVLVYTVALWEQGDYFKQLKAQWLPYYDDALRQERLAMVRRYCLNNLDHIPLFVERGLYFQAFQRLYHAFGEFLQALFISRRTYPIAYDKWIREQIEEILELPELYPHLPNLFEIQHFESQEIARKARELEQLFGRYVV
jgi:predicted nucleotidyltransferase